MGWKIARQLISKDLLGILEPIYTIISAVFSSNKQLPCWPCAAANLVLKAPSLSSKWWRWKVGPLSREKQWSSNHGPGVFGIDGWDCYPGTPREHLNVAGEFGGWKRCVSPLPQRNPYQKCLKHSETSEVVWSCSMQETAMSSWAWGSSYQVWWGPGWLWTFHRIPMNDGSLGNKQCYVLSLNSRQLDSSDVAMSPSFAGLVMVKAQWNNHFNVGSWLNSVGPPSKKMKGHL